MRSPSQSRTRSRAGALLFFRFPFLILISSLLSPFLPSRLFSSLLSSNRVPVSVLTGTECSDMRCSGIRAATTRASPRRCASPPLSFSLFMCFLFSAHVSCFQFVWSRLELNSILLSSVLNAHMYFARAQVVVEKKVFREQNKTRHQLGREQFLEEVWKWKREKGDRIYQQMQVVGSGCEWSRARFTMEPVCCFLLLHAYDLSHNENSTFRCSRAL